MSLLRTETCSSQSLKGEARQIKDYMLWHKDCLYTSLEIMHSQHIETDHMRIPRLAINILLYLIQHPLAEDTIEGIVEWWVLKQSVDQRVSAVKKALAQLVATGLVLESRRKDGKVYYHLNQSTMAESNQLR